MGEQEEPTLLLSFVASAICECINIFIHFLKLFLVCFSRQGFSTQPKQALNSCLDLPSSKIINMDQSLLQI